MKYHLMKNISRFLEPLKFNKIYSLTVFLEFLFWSMLWIIAIFFIRDITQVLEFGTRQDFFFVLKKYSLLFFALMICSHLIRNYGWVRFLENIRNTLYKKYLPAFIKLDNTFIEKQGTGKLNHLLQQGINAHSIMLNDTLYNIAKMVPFILITLYFVFQVYFLLGMLFIILYIGLLFYTKYFDDKQVKIRRKKHILKKNISQIVAKIIMSKFEILQSGKVQGEGDKIDELFKKIIQNNREQNFWGHILFRGSEIILFISKILVLYFIGEQYFFGDVSLTFVVTFMTVLLYFEKNSQDFLIFYKNITRDIHEMTGLWNFFDTTPQIQGYEEGKIFQHKSGQISLKKINYSYDASKPVFQNFSLEIPGNRVTALVGPSGGGKSTLVKLISGYIRQDSGDILVDEQNLKSVSLKSYYKDVGYLTQEPSVFDGTVEENLMYAVDNSLCPSDISLDEGDKKSSPSSSGKPAKHVGELQERLERTIKLAHCDFIYDLPNGLKTEIGERGVKLSGGQKQRLAIAKIFLKNPKIIILDEPTSALDSLSEQKITEAMHNLFKNRTVLVIAHRLQTVKHADEIIVIEGGEIRERGTHKSLVKKKGFYKQMLDLQSGF